MLDQCNCNRLSGTSISFQHQKFLELGIRSHTISEILPEHLLFYLVRYGRIQIFSDICPTFQDFFPVLWIIWEGNLVNRQILRIMLYQLTWQHIIISISEINPVSRLLIQFIRISVNLWLCNQKVINSLDGAAVNLISINQLLNPVFQLYTLSVLNKNAMLIIIGNLSPNKEIHIVYDIIHNLHIPHASDLPFWIKLVETA